MGASERLRDLLPAAHRDLLPDLFDRPAIQEPRATCSNCAMCPKDPQPKPALVRGDSEDSAPSSSPLFRSLRSTKNPSSTAIFFKPDLKCCTYTPTIPNFLVGAILLDDRPDLAEGKRRIKARIASRIGVTPQWLSPPRKQRVLLEAARGTSFGRSKALLCPYYDGPNGGLCTIWRHREAVCTTFFCKHVQGSTGDAFWMALKQLLGHAEAALARHAAIFVSEDTATEPRIPRLKLTVEDLEDLPPNEDDYAGYWGEWAGREEEFYIACHEYVKTRTKADLEEMLAEDPLAEGRARGTEAAQDVVDRYEALVTSKLAERLIPNPDMRITRPFNPEDNIVVTTYSIFDSQSLTPDLFEVVNQFRIEETVAETRARLKREHDLDIPDELLLSLQQHEILVQPRPAAVAQAQASSSSTDTL